MKFTVLIIDDNEEILEFIEDVLHHDYNVIKINNAVEAMDILQNNSVQLVVSDVMMPVLDGFEFCKTLKSNIEYCHIPIILLTAKDSLMSKIEGLEIGADAYIEKPFSPKHLLVQIGNLIANRNMIKEYFAKTPLVHLKSMANSKADEIFLEKLNEIIIENLDKADINSDYLAEMLNVSKPTLYRKIKAISNLSLNELTNLTKLKKAAELLAEGTYKVFEVSYMTGFSSPNHFNRVFLKQFKMSPSSFIRSKNKDLNTDQKSWQ